MLAERVKKWPDRWIAKGREEGLEAGRAQKAYDAARNLIDMGLLSDEQIAEAIGLPLAEIRQLRRQDQS